MKHTNTAQWNSAAPFVTVWIMVRVLLCPVFLCGLFSLTFKEKEKEPKTGSETEKCLVEKTLHNVEAAVIFDISKESIQ